MLAEERLEGDQVIVLAAEPEHQRSAGVGMRREPGQDLLGVLEIVAQLRAANGVRKRTRRRRRWKRAQALPRTPSQRLRRASDAAHRRDDPEFVAGGGAAVRSQGTPARCAPLPLRSVRRSAGTRCSLPR